MQIRKNARWLTQQEREAYLKAVLTLKLRSVTNGTRSMRIYDFYPLEHRLVRRRHWARDGAAMRIRFRDGGHRGPGFGAWHREWLLRYERDLQSVDPTVTLPYWDITDLQGTTDVIFQPDFMGPNGSRPDYKMTSGFFREVVPKDDRPGWWPTENGRTLGGFSVVRGLSTLIDESMRRQPTEFNVTGLTRRFGDFVRNLPSPDDLRLLLNATPYYQQGNSFSFSNQFEGLKYHVPGHNLVGGLMSAPPTSPNDPIFFMHHCGCDLVWALWQKRHDQSNSDNLPPTRPPAPMLGPGHYLDDPMWPWDGTLTTNSLKAVPSPAVPFPPADMNMQPANFPDSAFTRHVDALDVVRVRDVINHRNLGYEYDVEIPARLEKDGTTLAWVEPYFGDLNLTGTFHENSAGNPAAADLVFQAGGSVRGWIERANGDLHIRGGLIESERDFSNVAIQNAAVFRHFNQPLFYLKPDGNLHLKGRANTNQPPLP